MQPEEKTHEALKAILEELKRMQFNVFGELKVKEVYDERCYDRSHAITATPLRIDFAEPCNGFFIQNIGANTVYYQVERAVNIGDCPYIAAGNSVSFPLKTKTLWLRALDGDHLSTVIVWAFK